MNLKLYQRKMKRFNFKYIFSALCIIFIYNFFGVGDYILSKSFDEFYYPLNIDLSPVIDDLISGKEAEVKPINLYPYKFLTNSDKCEKEKKLDLLILVKSAMKNFANRVGIRKTYGQENHMKNKIVKILFFLGINESPNSETQTLIDNEISEHKDIIQMNFHDSYFNNTIKTMMSFRWAYEFCSNAEFYFFTDDDMYVSVKNLLDYTYGQIKKTADGEENGFKERHKHLSAGKNLLDYAHDQVKTADGEGNALKERDKHLFAGYVFKSAPQRFKLSKWRVSLEEYPWDMWPPYVTAGAYVVSNLSLKVLYAGSTFVKHFRFDDIYLGIVAKKIGLKPTHCPHFYFYKAKYSKEGYGSVIASHGYGNPDELIRVWTEQNIM